MKLTPAQAALFRECIALTMESHDGDAMTELCTGSPRRELENITKEVAHVPEKESGTCTFTLRQLHSIYAGITHAVVALPSEEGFHIRTGFYRENAIELANSMRSTVHDCMRSTS
ncbi:hypothetical protein SVIO_027920 [Streptomyces violaceusniger]|uniref:Uncharacterized protein n=1 Tax=Streptomyces violaceusniger TaxID=68280 RepID=A0A4D4L293_STRVO|nr:hypothetical protein SVIO_027920 [Streptomyces violaceusniger]